MLGFWIVLQALSGILTFSRAAWGGGEAGGTAWFAHIGGFLAGMALLFLMRPRRGAMEEQQQELAPLMSSDGRHA